MWYFLRISCPHTPQQNGVVERKHRHIEEMGLTLLYQAHLPRRFWLEAFSTAVYLINWLPTSVLSHCSPHEILFGSRPDYSHLKVFGCTCYPFLGLYRKDKLEPKSKKCTFLGYSNVQKGYKCLEPHTNRLYISRHVVFDETDFPFQQYDKDYRSSTSAFGTVPVTTLPLIQSISGPSSDLGHFHEASPPLPSNLASHIHTSNDTNHSSDVSCTTPAEGTSNNSNHLPQPSCAPPTPSHPMATHSNNGSRRRSSKYFLDYALTAQLQSSLCEPTTFSQAFSDPRWVQAMEGEYKALLCNNTWTLVPFHPSVNIVGRCWVYKVKEKSDGSIKRFKAHHVAKGYTQQEGFDVDETFSAVVKETTSRIVLSIAVSMKWPIRQLDVKNVFLHDVLSEEIYMAQLPGFVDSTYPHHVCKLNRVIYGL